MPRLSGVATLVLPLATALGRTGRAGTVRSEQPTTELAAAPVPRARSSDRRTAPTDRVATDRLAVLCGVPAATVHRVIRRQGLERQKAAREPVIRYEFDTPGAMVHCDTKKLGRIVGGPGHRIHGDRTRAHHGGIGWEVLHMAIDDCSRLVYAEMLGDERSRTAAHFLIRALRWFREQGISVDRLLTDNGNPYRSKAWRRVCRVARLRHHFTRPYHPQTNGKAERWIRTVLSECLYLEVFCSSEDRREGLAHFLQWYNLQRPHRALGGLSPCARLVQLQAA